MKFACRIIVLITSVLFISCGEKQAESLEQRNLQSDTELLGSWLLYERGYSPGAGYITQPVPENPSQSISFHNDLTFSSNIEELAVYTHYRVLEEPTDGRKILALFKSDPGSTALDPTHLEHSYQVALLGPNLKLAFRFCIEGCHMAFKPFSLAND